MKINVKLFAILRQRAGFSELSLELPAGSTVAEAAEAVWQKAPPARSAGQRAAFAVNQEYADASRKLNDGDELALLPPVSGG